MVSLPLAWVTLADLAVIFRPFGLLAPKDFKKIYLAFQCFDYVPVM
jgi:hypothetical protein